MSVSTYNSADGTGQIPVSVATPMPVASTAMAPAAPGAATATGSELIGGVYNSTPPTFTTGQQGAAQLDVSGNLRARLVVTRAAGADGLSNAGLGYPIDSTGAGQSPLVTAGHVFNGTTWDRVKKPNTVGRLVACAADTNATSVKASAGDVFGVVGFNAAGTVRYLKFYNKASAPTVGTDTPFLVIPLQASKDFSVQFSAPLYFSTGIAYGITTGHLDNSTNAPTAGDILNLHILYQ